MTAQFSASMSRSQVSLKKWVGKWCVTLLPHLGYGAIIVNCVYSTCALGKQHGLKLKQSQAEVRMTVSSQSNCHLLRQGTISLEDDKMYKYSIWLQSSVYSVVLPNIRQLVMDTCIGSFHKFAQALHFPIIVGISGAQFHNKSEVNTCSGFL